MDLVHFWWSRLFFWKGSLDSSGLSVRGLKSAPGPILSQPAWRGGNIHYNGKSSISYILSNIVPASILFKIIPNLPLCEKACLAQKLSNVSSQIAGFVRIRFVKLNYKYEI